MNILDRYKSYSDAAGIMKEAVLTDENHENLLKFAADVEPDKVYCIFQVADFSYTDTNEVIGRSQPYSLCPAEGSKCHSDQFNLDKLRIEYDAEDGLLTFKMPETRVHTDFAASICHRITVAAEPLIEDFRSRGTPDIELKGKSKSRSKKVPDIAWGRSPLETNPPIVAEVAYSHPNGSKDLEILKKICQGYLEGTRGRRKIRTVLGFKIYYPTNPTSNFEAILEHLDECFAGV
ncbi:hypothetical protein CkaCkLH20_02719 [Colletotrichum karsti]|uniref:Uncharacterized protein n=1 Tax=Colletotrichum karsti TaxID=1095194 RepID=A0A9P6IA10_9PEZI|nr:uncharacterized protein CkaCkLH20_02719 [Colletotrichum karsti]KAF9879908.1 hypothetical protein CkaCkLH20_02719 [Colletotrichum karsti]